MSGMGSPTNMPPFALSAQSEPVNNNFSPSLLSFLCSVSIKSNRTFEAKVPSIPERKSFRPLKWIIFLAILPARTKALLLWRKGCLSNYFSWLSSVKKHFDCRPPIFQWIFKRHSNYCYSHCLCNVAFVVSFHCPNSHPFERLRVFTRKHTPEPLLVKNKVIWWIRRQAFIPISCSDSGKGRSSFSTHAFEESWSNKVFSSRRHKIEDSWHELL